MTRRWLFAAALVMLAMSGCSAGTAEYRELIHEVDAFMGDLGAGNYAGARDRLCQEYSADAVREEFDHYAKPWRYKITGSEYTSRSNGLVNVLLTAADRQEQPYSFDMSYRDGRWRACRYLRGTYSSAE